MTSGNPSPAIQKLIDDIREQEAAITIAALVGYRQIILNIGPSWGRDYFYLTQRKKRVINIDIAPQSHLESLVRGNINSPLPFPDRIFDAVLMPEILEHLLEDAVALQETRRVLRDDGVLIVTVPFFHDFAAYHLRIHSPLTINRLLTSTGYKVVYYIERGGLISFPKVVHAMRRVFSPIIEPARFNQLVTSIDHFIARHFEPLLRFSRGYGCYIAATKAPVMDVVALNIREFQH